MSTRVEEDIRQNELLTVKEVAVYLRVSRVTVWRWCQRGTIPASRVGRNWRIRRDDLLCLLKTPHLSPNLAPVHRDGPTPRVASEPLSVTPSLLEQDEFAGGEEQDEFAGGEKENPNDDVDPDTRQD